MILRLASMSIAVTLAACTNTQVSTPTAQGGSGTPVALQQASHQRNAAREAVIYTFGSKTPDGRVPQDTFTDVRGTFYGETSSRTRGRHGTIFTVTPSGNETVLHTVRPKQGGLLNQLTLGPGPGGGPVLYGTGEGGGANGYGTIVRVTLSGHVFVLYNFAGGADGSRPYGGLINVNGTFYGTTTEGGGNGCSYGCGTVFSVTPSGAENVIYAFHGETQDGAEPFGGLVNLNGTLYGTTYYGGTYGKGTVYSVTASGTENVLHSFQGGGSDGADPQAGLIVVNGTLYGTTAYGGNSSCGTSFLNGCGTIFSMTPSGTETILHYFTGGADGSTPEATLLALNGKMYGTTSFSTTCTSARGVCGTVFSITPSGTEKVLHDFTGGSDGSEPYGGLLNIHTTLYGTTQRGGTYNDGTVYSVKLKRQ